MPASFVHPGAPRAHHRITTVTVPAPSLQLEVRLTRTHESQQAMLGSLHSARCASHAPTNYNCTIRHYKRQKAGCASRAPMNYNNCVTLLAHIMPRYASCVPTNYNRTVQYLSVCHYWCASCAPMNYNLFFALALPQYGCRYASRTPMNYNTRNQDPIRDCTRCASYAPTNYNYSAIRNNQYVLVRLARTHELQLVP